MRPLLGQLRAELLLASRRGENLLVTLVIPVALLLFFGVGMPNALPGGGGREFLVPGILALAVVSTSMVSLGIATAFERYYGVLKRLVGSPLPVGSLLAAKTLSVLAIECVQAALILGLAVSVLGWRPAGSLPLALAALLIGSVAFAGLGLLMAGTLRAEATLAAANGLYVVFLLIGGFVFPLDQLPGPIALVAGILPAGALANATRAALSGNPSTAYGSLATLVGWAVLSGWLAARTFRAE
ncbi:MAG: ABC transporter permease [Chloroflexi bacterium]|nr:ABC transporter permease [Chloroflexota bacterium]